MTPRERMTLLKLAVHVGEQGPTVKDADIERELADMLKARPDAAYLLLRRCLTLEASLDEAQARIAASQPLQPFAAGSYAVSQAADRAAPRRAAPAPSGLRDLLGEWTSTTLLSELADEAPPPAKGTGKGWGGGSGSH